MRIDLSRFQLLIIAALLFVALTPEAAVAQQVDDGPHPATSVTSPAARTAAGSALTIRSRTASSWAVERNHASKALGGR